MNSRLPNLRHDPVPVAPGETPPGRIWSPSPQSLTALPCSLFRTFLPPDSSAGPAGLNHELHPVRRERTSTFQRAGAGPFTRLSLQPVLRENRKIRPRWKPESSALGGTRS
jgi:hypothetical protein